MFDLPVGSKKEMRDATKFHEFLLDQGFEISQFSIYARFCNGKDRYESHLKRIEGNLPEKGEIHVLAFTDKQYEEIVQFEPAPPQAARNSRSARAVLVMSKIWHPLDVPVPRF